MTEKPLDPRYVELQFEAMSANMEKIFTKLDQVATITTQLAIVTERQGQQNIAIDRNDEMMDELEKRMVVSNEKIEEANQTTQKELDKWKNRIVGAGSVAVILVTLIQWLVLQQVYSYNDHLTNLDQNVQAIDRRVTKIENYSPVLTPQASK